MHWLIAAHTVRLSRSVPAFHPGTVSKGLTAGLLLCQLTWKSWRRDICWAGSLASSFLLFPITFTGFPFFQPFLKWWSLEFRPLPSPFPSFLSLACILLVNYLGRQPFIQQNWLHPLQGHRSFKKKESGFPLGGHIPVGRKHADQQKWFNFNQIHAPKQGLAWAGSLHVPEARTSASPNVSSSSPPHKMCPTFWLKTPPSI